MISTKITHVIHSMDHKKEISYALDIELTIFHKEWDLIPIQVCKFKNLCNSRIMFVPESCQMLHLTMLATKILITWRTLKFTIPMLLQKQAVGKALFATSEVSDGPH